jgi:hypothetical protein
MTQASLFDTARLPTLPHSGSTRISRECSIDGAKGAAPRRANLQARYVRYLEMMGRATDQQAADYLHCPISSVNSTRNFLRKQIEPVGKTAGQFGTPVTLWALRGRP